MVAGASSKADSTTVGSMTDMSCKADRWALTTGKIGKLNFVASSSLRSSVASPSLNSIAPATGELQIETAKFSAHQSMLNGCLENRALKTLDSPESLVESVLAKLKVLCQARLPTRVDGKRTLNRAR